MHELIEWGYGVIAAFQALRHPLLDTLFLTLSFMGREEFYLLLVPLLYWFISKRLALRLAALFLFSAYLNGLLKGIAAQPRPDPARVTVLTPEEGGGLPSGHSQNAVVTWGYFASLRAEPWFRWLMAALAVAIGLSRLYLGVHFPHDVLGGWLVGLLLLLLFLRLAPTVEGWLARQSLARQMALPAGLALAMALLYPFASSLSSAATLFGLALGAPLEARYVAFRERGVGAPRLLLRLLLGMIVALLIWRGLKPLLLPLEEVGAFLRYALLGLWLSVGAPWLFVRVGLAERQEEARPGGRARVAARI